MEDTKKINLLECSTSKNVKTKKDANKRAITHSDKWNFTEIELENENQILYIDELCSNNIKHNNICNTIVKEINKKINGYKGQDQKKNLYEPEKIVDIDYVINLLQGSRNKCFYCKKIVKILYENVREPFQWSLDRIDNRFGHNKENLVIACLDCNVSRKTMYHERYAFTKQLSIVKKN